MNLPDFFGIDIGNHTIKVAEVKYSGSNVELEKIGSIDTPYGVVGSEDENALGKLADAIKEIKEATNITTKKFIAALPESVIFSRVIELPKTEEGKIEETIYWEANQYMPIPVEKVQLDWLPIQEKQSEGNVIMQILLVAAPKKIIKQYQDLASKTGLELIALETETVATSRLITYKNKFDTPVLVLDFGANGTDMSVIKGNSLIFAQSLGTGSDALTKAIANDYGISIQQAEKYKIAYGLLENQGDGKIARSLTPVMEIIINELNKTINYFKEHLEESTPGEIYLVGDGAKLLGLPEFLSKRINIPCKLYDPIQHIKVPGKLEKELKQLSMVGFVVALGLAMKTE